MASIRLYSNTSNYIELASATGTASYIITFPSTPPTNNQVLTVNNNVVVWANATATGSTGTGTGGGTDTVFLLNGRTVNTSYTIANTFNAFSVGPITVSNTANVTVSTGSRWVVY